MFITLLVRFGLLSGHLLEKSCLFGWPCILIVFCLFENLVISSFGLDCGFGVFIFTVPVHCLLVTSIKV